MTQSFDPTRFTPPVSGPPPSLQDVLGSDAAALAAPIGGPFPDSNALFEALPGLAWRSIDVPYESLETEVRQDLVIHKFADRNGAHVEAQGRHPIQVRARVPFLNGLLAGANEHWQRPLYPFTRDNFLREVLKPGSGVLNHPELGPITVKCESMRWVLSATVRSGVWCDITWIESDDTSQQLEQNLSEPSPLAGMQAAASDLDLQLAELDPRLTPTLPSFTNSFEDFMSQLRQAVDSTTILQKQIAGQIDSAIAQAQFLQSLLTAPDNDTVLNWPIINACERLKAAAYDQKAVQLTKARPIGLFTTQKDATLAQVALSIGAPVRDIIMLNPAYVSLQVVPKETVVRFYLPQAA